MLRGKIPLDADFETIKNRAGKFSAKNKITLIIRDDPGPKKTSSETETSKIES